MAFRGGKPNISQLNPVVSARGRAPAPGKVVPIAGAPVMPERFDAAHRALWDRYIKPAFWLTRVDEMKCVMIINIWADYLVEGTKMVVTKQRELRCLGTELGFDPVARQRMSGEVLGRQERRNHMKINGGGRSERHLSKYA